MSVNAADVGAFFKGPQAHLRSKYQGEKFAPIATLVYSSLFLFIWQIVILITVRPSITLIAIGQLFASFEAISGNPAHYQGTWFKIWLGVDAVFCLVSVLWYTFSGGSIVWMLVSCGIWAAIIIVQFFTVRKLQNVK